MTTPRYSYAVTLEVVLYVEAKTEGKAANYAQDLFRNAINPEFIQLWRVADVERNDA